MSQPDTARSGNKRMTDRFGSAMFEVGRWTATDGSTRVNETKETVTGRVTLFLGASV